MDHPQFNWIANFICGVADDVLRDLYVPGKYRDVILPMTILRRLDAVLEPSTLAMLEMKTSLDKAKIIHQDQALRQAAGQAFYNTSKFTLRDLKARASQQQLKADFEAYLDGFSPNVQDILEKFEFRNQLPRLSKADALGTLIEKFLSPDVNLSPHPVLHGDGSIKQPGLDNHAMGTIFEELVRRFNEENNEEAGEHWTPRDAVTLMAKLVFVPVADRIDSGTYLVYDGACGTVGTTDERRSTIDPLTATAPEAGNASPTSRSRRTWSAGARARSIPFRSNNPSPCRRRLRARSFPSRIRPRRSSSRTPIRGLSSRAVTVVLRAPARTSACRTRTNYWIWGSSLWTIVIREAPQPSESTGSFRPQPMWEPSSPGRRTFRPSCIAGPSGCC